MQGPGTRTALRKRETHKFVTVATSYAAALNVCPEHRTCRHLDRRPENYSAAAYIQKVIHVMALELLARSRRRPHPAPQTGATPADGTQDEWTAAAGAWPSDEFRMA